MVNEELENDVLGFDPKDLDVNNPQPSTTSNGGNPNIYHCRPSEAKSDDGIYRSQIKIIYAPRNLKKSVLEQQSYTIQDEKGYLNLVSSLTNNDKSCPIFKAWKTCHFSENKILQNQALPVSKGGKGLFDKRFARYVTIQVMEDNNQPELVGKYMLWKCPKVIWEAINAKQNRQTYVGHYNIKDYCNDYNIEYPTEPTNVKYATEADWLKTLSIKELNRYLTLQTYCAVFGNFIHPKYGSNFHTARQLAIKVEKAPYEVTENGRDTVIYNKTLSVDIETIDNKYFELQAIHRDKQSEFNALRHQFEVYRDSKFTQDQTEYDKKILEYKQRVTELSSQWQTKKDELERECANMKIVIPDALKSIYDKVNRLGK